SSNSACASGRFSVFRFFAGRNESWVNGSFEREKNMCAKVGYQFAVKVLSCFIAASALCSWASAQTQPASGGPALSVGGLSGPHDLSLLVNKSAVLSTNRAYRRISVGQPDIIEANAIGPSKILVTA